MYDGSVEENKYVNTIMREKRAFENLVSE